MDTEYFSAILEREFVKRKTLNTSYSLRMFAKDLGISPALLSQLINQKKALTPKILSLIGSKLNLDDKELKKLIENQKTEKKSRHIKNIDKQNIKSLNMETFAVISEWYHYVILEIMNMDDYKMTPEWLAKRLSITKADASKAIENLLAVRLLEYDKNGQLILTESYTIIDEYNFSSIAMRERQKQILKLSAEKIDKIDIEKREHGSITISMDPDLLPEVKKRIRDFRRTLGNYIAKNSKKVSQVYEIQISCFPFTSEEKL